MSKWTNKARGAKRGQRATTGHGCLLRASAEHDPGIQPGIQTLFITNPRLLRGEPGRSGQTERRGKKRGFYHKFEPGDDSGPKSCSNGTGLETSRPGPRHCLRSHSNSHESRPHRSVSLRIISAGSFWTQRFSRACQE